MADLTGGVFADANPIARLVLDQPGHCSIDARQPHDINEVAVRFGWDRVVLSFSCDPTVIGMVAGDFSVGATRAGEPPGISDIMIDNIANTATVLLDDMITPGAWTCIEHLASGNRWCAGYLPGDAKLDGLVTGGDIIALIDSINLVPGRLLPNYATDINRSGVTTGADILRLIDLLNGAGEFDAWITRSLSLCPSEP